jgi:hypothetical protein
MGCLDRSSGSPCCAIGARVARIKGRASRPLIRERLSPHYVPEDRHVMRVALASPARHLLLAR